MRISVIVPSFLGNYKGAASMRELKFVRSVKSFLSQDYENKELIIVSDGCKITNEICRKNGWAYHYIQKQHNFSGEVRNEGLKHATGDIITYLDTDDYYENSHLKSISEGMKDNEWVYWDDYALTPNYDKVRRRTEMAFAKIGTSCIAHRKNGLKWGAGYGHDWEFIQKLTGKSEKIETAGYVVCHIPGRTDV